MIKLAVVTSTRAEYGLLVPLIKAMMCEPEIEMQLLVSGTHLVRKYGYTVRYIRQDKIPIAYEVPLFDDDFSSTEQQVSDVIAKAVAQCGAIFAKERYDAVIVLGDRYELLGFCSAAVVCRIPIVHIHGGEITEGAIDDKIRHAITKLSSVHFPSIPEYAHRIIQMGENPDYVYAVGALGIDNILGLKLLDRRELLSELNIETNLPLAAVTYHPVTGEKPELAAQEMIQVLDSLISSNIFAVITMPNSDVGGDDIYRMIVSYVERYQDKMVLEKSLGQVRYLSLLKNADIMIGNSSSGLLESASFHLPVVDIGDRQKGRVAPANVVHCSCNQDEIVKSIETCLNNKMKERLQGYENPYGDGKAAQRIVDKLKKIDFADKSLICKHFFDFGCENER